jgi:hypothetical protein
MWDTTSSLASELDTRPATALSFLEPPPTADDAACRLRLVTANAKLSQRIDALRRRRENRPAGAPRNGLLDRDAVFVRDIPPAPILSPRSPRSRSPVGSPFASRAMMSASR